MNDSFASATAPRRPLEGIRVVDFGQFIAGPLAAALLGDFGADVIRVERPEGGADRFVQPIGAHMPGGAVYLQINRNKRSLALDSFDARAREIVDRLIMHADVVVANAPDATRDAMGLSYERVSALNPRLILATCTAFGSGGALANAPGFDGIGQAMSGAMHMSGKDGEPRKAYAHYVDHLSAALSAFGVMMALRERERTGRGQHVETSLLRSALLTMAANLTEEDVLQIGRHGIGNRAHLAGPADVFRTRDGHVLVQVIGDSMFGRCARLMQRVDWLDDPRFVSDETRCARRDPERACRRVVRRQDDRRMRRCVACGRAPRRGGSHAERDAAPCRLACRRFLAPRRGRRRRPGHSPRRAAGRAFGDARQHRTRSAGTRRAQLGNPEGDRI